MINHQLGRNEAAAGLIGKVVELRSNMMAVYFNIALALTALGTLGEAIARYQRITISAARFRICSGPKGLPLVWYRKL